MNSLSAPASIGRTSMLFISWLYNTNRYLLTLLDLYGNFPVRYVSIFLLGSMILLNTVLVHWSSGFISSSYCILEYCGLVDLRFFVVWSMWPLDVSIYWVRCLLTRFIVKLGHVAKYLFFMDWIRVWSTELNSVVWYNCSSYCLFLSAIVFFVWLMCYCRAWIWSCS